MLDTYGSRLFQFSILSSQQQPPNSRTEQSSAGPPMAPRSAEASRRFDPTAGSRQKSMVGTCTADHPLAAAGTQNFAAGRRRAAKPARGIPVGEGGGKSTSSREEHRHPLARSGDKDGTVLSARGNGAARVRPKRSSRRRWGTRRGSTAGVRAHSAPRVLHRAVIHNRPR